MRSLLITGANRGIGLELVKQFLNHPSAKPEILIATARKPKEAKELQELSSQHKNLYILPLDVTKFGAFNEFVTSVNGVVGEQGLNVLVNNAGILLHRNDAKLDKVSVDSLTTQFMANTVGPIMLTQALLPLVKKAAKASSEGISIHRAALLYMSAVLGSVKSNEGPHGGGWWGYRESKAALDIAARTIYKEVLPDGIGVLVLHPGWVKTDMGGPSAPISVSKSVEGLIKVSLSLTDKNNGSFVQYDGATLPW